MESTCQTLADTISEDAFFEFFVKNDQPGRHNFSPE